MNLRKLFKVINKETIPIVMLPIVLVLIFISRNCGEVYRSPIVFESRNVRVIDGDTIELVDSNIKIRLLGIDTPELKQQCLKSNNFITECGHLAKNKIQELIGNNIVKCSKNRFDRYRRLLAYCYVNDLNLNLELVKQGYAYAYSNSNVIFKLHEIVARIFRKGLWQGEFQDPKVWRKKNRA